MFIRVKLLTGTLCLILAACQVNVESSDVPDTVYLGGTIHSGVPGVEPLEAVAVKDGRILATGARDTILGTVTAATEIVDLGSNTMLPGLYDNHVHAGTERRFLMEWKGGMISEVPEWVREAESIADLQAALRREAARVGPGEWIVGALSREIWPNSKLPTRGRSRCRHNRKPGIADSWSPYDRAEQRGACGSRYRSHNDVSGRRAHRPR